MKFFDDLVDFADTVVSDSIEIVSDIASFGAEVVTDVATEVASKTKNFIEENKEEIKTTIEVLATSASVTTPAIFASKMTKIEDIASSVIGNRVSSAKDISDIINSPLLGKTLEISQKLSASSVEAMDDLRKGRSPLDIYSDFVEARHYARSLDISQREIGDHLVTERDLYTHHGIYIGDDRVIHYAGFANGISSGKIEITSLSSFINGRKTYVKRYSFPLYQGRDVVRRARSRLGEDLYNVLLNNCEHFATWCVMGEHKCTQLELSIPNKMTVLNWLVNRK